MFLNGYVYGSLNLIFKRNKISENKCLMLAGKKEEEEAYMFLIFN